MFLLKLLTIFMAGLVVAMYVWHPTPLMAGLAVINVLLTLDTCALLRKDMK